MWRAGGEYSAKPERRFEAKSAILWSEVVYEVFGLVLQEREEKLNTGTPLQVWDGAWTSKFQHRNWPADSRCEKV